MIRQTNLRTRGNEPPFDPFVVPKRPSEALESLVLFELGYGGYVTELTETKVVTVTRILDCVDTTIFEGTAEDMKLLVEAAVIWLQLNQASNTKYSEAVTDFVFKATKGIPLLVKMGAGFLTGQVDAKTIAIVLLGTEDKVPELMKMEVKDLLAVVDLVRADGLDLETALPLALPLPPSLSVMRSVYHSA